MTASLGSSARKTSRTWCAAIPFGGRAERGVERLTVRGPLGRIPLVGDGGCARELRQDGVDVADGVQHYVSVRACLHRLCAQMRDRHTPGPVLVVDLDAVEPHRDREVGAVDHALDIGPPGAAHDAESARVRLGDEPFGVERGYERDTLRIEEPREQLRLRGARQRKSCHDDRSAARPQQPLDVAGEACGRGAAPGRAGEAPPATPSPLASPTSSGKSRCTGPGGSLTARPNASARTAATFPCSRRNDALGERREQRLVVDQHLRPATELPRRVRAGDGDDGGAVQPGAADAGRQVGRARADRGDTDAGHSRDPTHGLGHEAGGGLACGEHVAHPVALAYRLDERQDWPAGHAEDPTDSGAFQHSDGELDVIHVTRFARRCLGWRTEREKPTSRCAPGRRLAEWSE